VLTVVGTDELTLTLTLALKLAKERLLVHERLLDVCLGVLKGATIVPEGAAHDAIERLRSFHDELLDTPTYSSLLPSGVPEAFKVCTAFADVVALAVRKAEDKAVSKVNRRTRRRLIARAKRRWGDGPLPPSTQACLVGPRRVAVREPSVDLTADTQSESSESETCGPDSAAEESSSSSEDDEMTEVDSQYEDESDGSDD
jgi:hypothetical protein